MVQVDEACLSLTGRTQFVEAVKCVIKGETLIGQAERSMFELFLR